MISAETKQVQLLDEHPECLAKVFYCKGFGGAIIVPEEPAPQVNAEDLIPLVTQTLARLPNPDIINRLVLWPDSSIKSDTDRIRSEPARRVAGEWTLFVPVPGASQDVAVELETAWAGLLQLAFPIERYLFNLSYRIDPAARQYLDADNMWIAVIRNLLTNATYTIEVSSAVTTLVAAHSLKESLSKKESEHRTKWERALTKLEEMVHGPAAEALLQSTRISEQQDTATKLALHLFDSEIIEKVTDVRSLDFTAEPLGDTVLKKLKYLQKLESLILDNTIFNSETLSELRWLQRLRNLSVQRTNIVDSAIFFLAQCHGLEQLDCSDTRITGSSIKHFQTFKRLRRLNVSRTLISEESLKELESIAGLEVISK